ncbi:MAG: hypothetical protein IPQ02_15805 [Saprospiraceae bacterium]|nr:hypothetical protein [Candidatus Defluviibacterium haderslevense]
MDFNYLLTQFILPSPCEEIIYQDLHIRIKRDYLIHLVVSGNKWRKLEGHLLHYLKSNYTNISSIGGAHSNHLHALAWTCNQLKIPCELYIYGHPENNLSPTMHDALLWNAKLNLISRSQKETIGESMAKNNTYWIGEGGIGPSADLGIAKLLAEFPKDFDHKNNIIAIAYGSGTTLNAILNQTQHVKLACLSPVKGKVHLDPSNRIIILEESIQVAFGGFNKKLLTFITSFYENTGILLDPIYTGRLMMAFTEFLQHHPQTGDIYFLHSGGLQSWIAYNKRHASKT